jgi:thiol-disulfide isomerase/thioredoxin
MTHPRSHSLGFLVAAFVLFMPFAAGCGSPAAPPTDAAARDATIRERATIATPPVAVSADTAGDVTPTPPARPPIYDPTADGKAVIAAAIAQAARADKHVLIEWGGNWCGWCYKLHDVFTQDSEVEPIVFQDYELVLLDEGSNRELMESYGGKDREYSFPHLTILDAEGNVLTNQETGSLEDGPKHVPERVATFLKKWAPEPVDAEARLAAALKTAGEENKRVFVRVGTPYCGWCKVLDSFLLEHESLFARDFVDLRIDTMRMTGGEAVANRLKPGDSLGIPWMVILDASGEVVANSVGPKGNIGYPVLLEEIDHFMSMLRGSATRMTPADMGEIRRALDDYRIAREERLRAGAQPEQ